MTDASRSLERAGLESDTDDEQEPTSCHAPVTIDCGTCDVRGLACGDCVVTVLLGAPPEWLDEEEQRAIEVLAESGLVPPLRLVASEGARLSDGEGSPAGHHHGALGQETSPSPWRAAPERRGTG